ncbi:MAG TPA: hypothetical protein VMD47_12525 [Candidatus Acidoferrales bacterium]|nr:hypothetical protein [Candidatus Acidoferrales bacterium]
MIHVLAATIAIVINGVKLPLQPPPMMIHGELYVPVRRTIDALGLPFTLSGSQIETQVGARTITITIGQSGTLEIKSVLYAPVRFFTDVLGASAAYDSHTHTVNIVAQLVGTSANGLILTHTSAQRYGTVTAVDLSSDPPTVTLDYNATIHTVPIGANAVVDLHDVVANVTVPGELSDVRAGDFTRIYMDRAGHVERVEDEFGSYAGPIAAATSSEFVLADGHVIVPDRDTQIVLNGQSAAISDLRVGDRVIVRYNVETDEIRSIAASRTLESATPQPGAPQITSVTSDATRPLRAGDSFTVTMQGTPGGAATFDIGSYVTNLAMAENTRGTYTGTYQIPEGANFTDVPIVVHLRVAAQSAPDVQAAATISASGSPPGVSDFAPGEGAVVNTNSPAIYATFVADAVPVNPSSIVLWVDGRDVTSECLRTPTFIQYLPSYSYRSGDVHVTVRVADLAGNTTTKSWTFVIRP